jgi:Ca2+-transporting ATPase
MEPAEGDEMNRGPVLIDESLIDNKMLKRIPFMVTPTVLSTFGWFLFRFWEKAPQDVLQSETFTVLVLCQWFNVLNCKSPIRSIFSLNTIRNSWLLVGLLGAIILHVLVIYWQPLARFFHTSPIPMDQFVKLGLVASLVLWTEEIRKYIYRRNLRLKA